MLRLLSVLAETHVIAASHVPARQRPLARHPKGGRTCPRAGLARGHERGIAMEYAVGVALALGVVIFARIVGFDRDRSFYPVMLVVIASYYDLFSAIGGSGEALAIETLVSAIFVVAAIIGFKTSLWVVVVALIGHGIFDYFHGDMIANHGTPEWWPLFCLSFDVAVGAYLAYILLRAAKSGGRAGVGTSENSMLRVRGSTDRSSFRRRIRSHVEAELRKSLSAERAGDAAKAFWHLERAHVLGQASTIEHVRVHARMLTWGLRQRDAREIAAQGLRIVGAAILTGIKAIPHGNTGGSKVGAFRSMPIPNDLAAIIASASTRRFNRLLSSMLMIGTLMAVGGCDSTPTDVRFARSGEHSIAYRVLGSGGSAIVMIAGLGDGMASFKDVARELSKSSTVIVYDRAGYGASGTVHGLADAAAADRDLSNMLLQSGVAGPYVFVGHSLGGLFAEYFAAKHPEQVSGLILEESRPTDFTRRCELAEAGQCKPPAFLVKLMASGAQSEFAALDATVAEVEQVTPVREKAVLVVSRPTAADARPFDRLWSQCQEDLTLRYAAARHLVAPGGGHYVHQDETAWFVESVRKFVTGIEILTQ